jgi:hypothetical protein
MAGIIFNIHEAVKNSAFNVFQEPIQMFMTNEVEAFEKESIIDKIFVKKTSDKYREEFRSYTAMDGFKPTEDMEVAGISDFEESYNKQFVFQTWTNSFVISKQTMEDKRDMDVTQMTQSFIKSFGRTREQYAVNFIAAGLGATNDALRIGASAGKGADTVDGTIEGAKQQYFHNAHKPIGYGKEGRNFTQSNKFYAVVDGLSNANALAVNAEEVILDVIGQAENHMNTYKDDKGNIVPVEVDTIILGKDYRLNDLILSGLKSKYGSPMGGNGVNLVFGKYEVVTNPYLSDVEGFKDTNHGLILIDPQRNREGLGAVWFDRTPLEVRSYKDDKTEANVWSGRARFGAGFGDWRAMAYLAFTSVAPANADEITPVVTGVNLSKNVQ